MWFDVSAARAEIEARAESETQRLPLATPATTATKPPQIGNIAPNVAVVAGVAAPRPEFQETQNRTTTPSATRKANDFKHGVSVAGNPLTWTGKVVSLEAWRTLSNWEKHGPD